MGRLPHLLPDDADEVKITRAWRVIGSETKAVPDVVYPFDPAVIRAIHEFDPNIVPLFCKAIYRASTGEIRVFGWHTIGSFYRDPHYKIPSWAYRVMRPASGPIGIPVTKMNMHIKDKRARKGDGLPGMGAYLPCDWRVYVLLREMYAEWTAKQIMAFQKKVQDDARAKASAAAEEHAAYAVKHDERIMSQHFENIDDADLARLAEPPQPKPQVVVP
jgi:hypothetical protein